MRIIFNLCTNFIRFAANRIIMGQDKKQERTVVHLEMDGQHYYYGNLKALCDNWDKEKLGIAYTKIRNFGLSPDQPFLGEKCTIRKGIIVTSPRSKNEKE